VVDKNGMAVALTSTINLIFGSQVLDPETGIILNDEMDDFSIPNVPNSFGLYPSPCIDISLSLRCDANTLADNFPEPGKRPLSSTAPTILEHVDGSFYIAIGGSGGSRIFPSVFQALLNLDWGMDLSQAIEYGRLHDQLYPLYLDADDVYPKHILHDLRERGHNVSGNFWCFRTSMMLDPTLFLTIVADVNRVAAVIQAVMRNSSTIYGKSNFHSSYI